ncbi:HDOD domain-containing protein [Nitrospina watsonii]|uniref:Metal dependent phosphohydrolase n=1 Tax=Nitrospina watsonii TaxID=1323948 RepID=A0ABM9HG14_9BACT|nr:HDOD domain-containing protein [Nitrospina watsonii]CAI2719222.1 Putative Metal dependent phosphohydrolase [Nitrospina watsonii]
MSASLLESFRNLPDLPTHPEQIAKVLDELNKTSSMDYNLLHLIQYDPAIATRILAVANLPVYGYERRVESLQQAAGLLSPSLVTSIILTTPVFEIFRDADHACHQQFDHLQLWAHCAVTGVLAAYIARKLESVEEGICLTLGLIHDMGKMALIVNHPKQVLEAVERCRKEGGALNDALREMVGCTPYEVAAQLAGDWHYPGILIAHLRDMEAATGSENSAPVMIVRLAKRLAEDWKYGDGLELPDTTPVDSLLPALGVSPADLDQWKPEMQSQADKLARSILAKMLS